MEISQKEITILGAGPAGMTAALNLAINGYLVIVHEQKGTPGARFSNGWQVIENYSSHMDALEELNSMHIAHNFDFAPQSSMQFFDSHLKNYVHTADRPYGYFIKRGPDVGTLDSSLYSQAVKAGVKFHFDSRIDPVDADIIAGGSSHASGIAKEIVFETEADDTFITILDNHLTPHGFSYLFIINGHATIGAAILRNFNRIHSVTDNVLLRFRQIKDFTMSHSTNSVSSVGFYFPKSAIEGHTLYAGESAGFQDFLFGIGIRRSIQSGFCAAQSIISGQNYDKLWKQKFGDQLFSGILNRFVYENLGNAGLSGVLKLGKYFDFRQTGHYLQNPSIIRKFFIHALKVFWGNRHSCKHGERCAWCRPPVK